MALCLRAFISRSTLDGGRARLEWALICDQIQHSVLGLIFVIVLFGQEILLLVLLMGGYLDWREDRPTCLLSNLLLWLRLELLLRCRSYTAANRRHFHCRVELDTRDGCLRAWHLGHCAVALLLLLRLSREGLGTLCKFSLVGDLSGVERRLGRIVEDTGAGARVLGRHIDALLLRLYFVLHSAYALLALNGLHRLLKELPILAVVAPAVHIDLGPVLLLL